MHSVSNHRKWFQKIPCPILFGALVGILVVLGVLGAAVKLGKIEVQWAAFLGPFHVVMVHFPLVLFFLAALLELAWWRKGGEELRAIILWLMQLAVLGALVTLGLGLLLARQDGYGTELVREHRNLGVAVMWASVAALALLTWAHEYSSTTARYSFRVVLTGVLVLLAWVGHTGGNLSHGKSFLWENSPTFMRSWMVGEPEKKATNLIHDKDEFTQKILPILNRHCVKCHGPEKQKGDLRVDERESLIVGGDSELPALVPGDPAASVLIRLILLPEEHEEVMPPEGKGRITSGEADRLIRWIQNGAPFAKTK